MAATLNAAKRLALKFGLFCVAALPASCHFELTGPALWNHGSSYAFEAWLTLWVLAIIWFFFALSVDLDAA